MSKGKVYLLASAEIFFAITILHSLFFYAFISLAGSISYTFQEKEIMRVFGIDKPSFNILISLTFAFISTVLFLSTGIISLLGNYLKKYSNDVIGNVYIRVISSIIVAFLICSLLLPLFDKFSFDDFKGSQLDRIFYILIAGFYALVLSLDKKITVRKLSFKVLNYSILITLVLSVYNIIFSNYFGDSTSENGELFLTMLFYFFSSFIILFIMGYFARPFNFFSVAEKSE